MKNPIDGKDHLTELNGCASEGERTKYLLSVIQPLYDAWPNKQHGATLEYLVTIASILWFRSIVKSIPHTVLECGSGLSTVVCKMFSDAGVHLVSLEDSTEWKRKLCSQYPALNHNVILAPKMDYGDHAWYNRTAVDQALKGKPLISTLFCDGPDRLSTKGRRIGINYLRSYVAGGTGLYRSFIGLFDDTQNKEETALAQSWRDYCEVKAKYLSYALPISSSSDPWHREFYLICQYNLSQRFLETVRQLGLLL